MSKEEKVGLMLTHKMDFSELKLNSVESLPSRVRHQGKVLWFNAAKGFGFIKPLDPHVNDGKDLFVHFHFLIARGFKSLRQDDIVEFCVGKNEKGACAHEVKIIKAAEQQEIAP